MSNNLIGKLLFSVITIAGCYFSDEFWSHWQLQIALPALLVIVFFERRIFRMFGVMSEDDDQQM